jgi:hypothetical protein
MNGNPFFIDPLGGYGKEIVQGLTGLGGVIGQQQELKRKKALMEEAQGIFASNDPNKIAEFSLRSPEIAQQVSTAIKFKNDQTKQNLLDSMRRILSGEDPRQVIIERAQMVQDQGGDPIDTLNELAIYDQDPEAYKGIVANSYAWLDPQGFQAYRQATSGQKGEVLTGNMGNVALAMFGTSDVSKLTPGQRQQVTQQAQATGGAVRTPAKIAEWQKYQELQQTDPEAAKAFGMSAGFVGKDGKMSSFAEKQMGQATDAVFEAESNFNSFNQLADDIEKANLSGGVFGGKWKEALKDITGMQDADTDLRKKFNLVRGSQSSKFLPPGPATDKDVQFALSGFPTENASGQQMATFLRGLAKLEAVRAEFNNFRADYIANNKSEAGLVQAWKREKGIEGGKPAQSMRQKPTQETPKFNNTDYEAAAKKLSAQLGRKVTADEVRQKVGM